MYSKRTCSLGDLAWRLRLEMRGFFTTSTINFYSVRKKINIFEFNSIEHFDFFTYLSIETVVLLPKGSKHCFSRFLKYATMICPDSAFIDCQSFYLGGCGKTSVLYHFRMIDCGGYLCINLVGNGDVCGNARGWYHKIKFNEIKLINFVAS